VVGAATAKLREPKHVWTLLVVVVIVVVVVVVVVVVCAH